MHETLYKIAISSQSFANGLTGSGHDHTSALAPPVAHRNPRLPWRSCLPGDGTASNIDGAGRIPFFATRRMALGMRVRLLATSAIVQNSRITSLVMPTAVGRDF
jgi:hypothetical protein